MIKIDATKCKACGSCIKVCHEYCLHLVNDTLIIDYAYCSTCTQCIAICPQQALTWDNVQPQPFDKSLYPRSTQLEELLKERRTIRDFTNKKIEKPLLEEIVNMAIYAPTHNFNFRAVIIDDEDILETADSLILRFSALLYKWIYKLKVMGFLMKLFAPDMKQEFLKAKPKLEIALKRNRAFKTMPAAMILIVGHKRLPLSLESAQYALYNMDLYAQSKGLACRNLVGNQMILNRSRKFRKMIGLDKKEKIFGTILMGYPAIKFRNKVAGKNFNIQWNAIRY